MSRAFVKEDVDLPQQRTEAIGVKTAAGSDQLRHRARREAFA